MKLLLTGDIMLNGHWRSGGYPIFSRHITNYILQHDLVFLNLETPIKNYKGENKLKVPRLNTAREGVEYLSELNPTLINIGNNHLYDQLYDGYKKTLWTINDIGSIHIGAEDEDFISSYYRLIKTRKHTIHILSYVDPNTHPNLPANARIRLRWLEDSNLKNDISKIKKEPRDIIIVSFHWGFDNHKLPAPYQRKLAHYAIELGADIVWGHHSHVIQPIEYYRGKLVIYCQGNSCADSINKDRILNKYQKESFLLSFQQIDDVKKVEYEFIKIRRNKPEEEAYAVDRDYKPKNLNLFQKFSPTLYNLFYQLYLIHYYTEKLFLYLFGPEKNTMEQLKTIFKRTFK